MKRTLIITLFTICCLLINSINFGNASCHGNECIQKYNERIEIYNNALEKEDYITCLNALEEALKYSDYRKEELNEQIRNIAEYLGGVSSQNEDYSEALKYYKKALEISEKAETLYNIGWICYKLGKYKTGITYLEKAKQKTQDSELYEGIVKLLNYMTEMSEYEDDKENRKTNDEYGFYQYYLSGINIFEAREKLPQNTNKVIIAIIDDGVNINHPDLKNKVRTNKNEIPGDGKDNDHNGFIDDYNGRNFVDNNNIISSPGDHGTMVAGIIAANINNKIGISGIVPNIEIMPLMVFGGDGSANGNNIIDAINYAVDNGANIINLSLVQEDEPLYNDYYDYALKKANKKGIIIIASAGNGDKGNDNKGINTTVTKVSPVCNEDNKKNVIGVGSLTKTGTRSDWSNYGECVDFYMYGEDIYTTAVNPDGEPYARAEGTSFSAPIVSGIVGLGYNKFGQLSPEVVYDNLKKSLNKNIINAAKYLDNLSNSIGELGKAIGWLMSNGFTVAKNTNEFNSNKSIRRDEAAKLFVLYANKFNKNIVVNDDYSCIFSDLGDTQGDLTPYVIDACRFGLLSGKNGKFMPKSALTNAQVITVFMRLISGKMDESGVHFADRYFIQAYKLGLINGLTLGNQSNYEKNATRGEVAILLYRGINILEKK